MAPGGAGWSGWCPAGDGGGRPLGGGQRQPPCVRHPSGPGQVPELPSWHRSVAARGAPGQHAPGSAGNAMPTIAVLSIRCIGDLRHLC
jgi:hypothetical protein